MPRNRHRKQNSTAKPLTHEAKLRRLSRAGIQADPTNPRSVSRVYYERFENKRSYKYRERVPRDLERKAPKATRDELKRHGFYTTKRGVVVDGPRDRRRKPIKGSRVEVMRGGVVKTSAGQRRDIIYGFTRAEKKKFAQDPDAFTKSKLKELMKRFPVLRGKKKQVRLQWGAYRGTKDFAPDYWTKQGSGQYFQKQTPEMKRRGDKGKLADKLTGLHIVVHVPREKRGKKKK